MALILVRPHTSSFDGPAVALHLRKTGIRRVASLSMHTIDTFQVWVHEQRSCAETEEERLGWIRLDAWINRQMVFLKARYPHQNVHNLPVFRLVEEDCNDE